MIYLISCSTIAFAIIVSLTAHQDSNDYPQHLVDILFETERYNDIYRMEIDVELTCDIPEQCNIFIAPLQGKIYGSVFYLGLASRIPNVHLKKTPLFLGAPETKEVGKGIIFARTGTLNVTSLKTAQQGFSFVTDLENGEYISSRTLYPWKKGHYTFEVVRNEHAKYASDDANSKWYLAFVRDRLSDTTVFCGMLRFKDDKSSPDKWLHSFVEIVLEPKSVIPSFSVYLKNIKINNATVSPKSVLARYNKGVPAYAKAFYETDKVEIRIDSASKQRINEKKIEVLLPSSQR